MPGFVRHLAPRVGQKAAVEAILAARAPRPEELTASEWRLVQRVLTPDPEQRALLPQVSAAPAPVPT